MMMSHITPTFSWMTTSILIEPLLGRRPWMAARLAEEGARRVFGPLAINAEKKDEEGEFRVEQICWGGGPFQHGGGNPAPSPRKGQ